MQPACRSSAPSSCWGLIPGSVRAARRRYIEPSSSASRSPRSTRRTSEATLQTRPSTEATSDPLRRSHRDVPSAPQPSAATRDGRSTRYGTLTRAVAIRPAARPRGQHFLRVGARDRRGAGHRVKGRLSSGLLLDLSDHVRSDAAVWIVIPLALGLVAMGWRIIEPLLRCCGVRLTRVVGRIHLLLTRRRISRPGPTRDRQQPRDQYLPFEMFHGSAPASRRGGIVIRPIRRPCAPSFSPSAAPPRAWSQALAQARFRLGRSDRRRVSSSPRRAPWRARRDPAALYLAYASWRRQVPAALHGLPASTASDLHEVRNASTDSPGNALSA